MRAYDCDCPQKIEDDIGNSLRDFNACIMETYPAGRELGALALAKHIEPVGAQYDLLTAMEEKVEQFLLGSWLTGWHMTNLSDPESIRKNGIIAWGVDQSLARVESLCDICGLAQEETSECLEGAEAYLARDASRRKSVHFYSSRSIEEQYLQYADMVGGELVRWTIGNIKSGKYTYKLQELGHPMAIKFMYPVDLVSPLAVRKLFRGISRVHIVNLLCGECMPPSFDAYIEKSVLPEWIVGAIELDTLDDGCVAFGDDKVMKPWTEEQ